MIWRWHDMGTVASIHSTRLAGWRQTEWERGGGIQQIRVRPKHTRGSVVAPPRLKSLSRLNGTGR